MTLEKTRRLSLLILIAYLTILAAAFSSSVNRGLRREDSVKREYLESVSEAIAPSVWGFYNDMAVILLNNFVVQENHPYMDIRHNDGTGFYHHESPPDGKPWLYRLGILKLRHMEIPVMYEGAPIARIRTEYISSWADRGLVQAVMIVLAGLSGILIRRVFVVSISRSRTRVELKKAQDRLVVNDRIAFFSLLSMKLAHEFNTPLGIIITAQSFLSAREMIYMGTEEGREMLAMIEGAANRMKSLIRRMQDSVPDTTLEEIQNINMNELVQGIVMGIRRDGDEVRISFSPDENWAARPRALNLVLEEIITNASRHGRNSSDRLILNIAGNDNGGRKYIIIEDEGSGIPDTLKGQVFSPFVKGRPLQSGHGLGLYLAKIYTDQYLNGSLEYETGEHGGARFTISCTSQKRL